LSEKVKYSFGGVESVEIIQHKGDGSMKEMKWVLSGYVRTKNRTLRDTR